MAQVLGDLSRSRCLEVAGLAFTTGALDPETLGCRTHLWALKAAGVGVGLGLGGAGRVWGGEQCLPRQWLMVSSGDPSWGSQAEGQP